MEKAKIQGISSKEYPEGRIDSFRIPLSENLVFPLLETFGELGFSKDIINEIDLHYPSTRGHFFFYSPKAKIYFFIDDKILNLIIDSNISRDEIIEIMEKNFIFPE